MTTEEILKRAFVSPESDGKYEILKERASLLNVAIDESDNTNTILNKIQKAYNLEETNSIDEVLQIPLETYRFDVDGTPYNLLAPIFVKKFYHNKKWAAVQYLEIPIDKFTLSESNVEKLNFRYVTRVELQHEENTYEGVTYRNVCIKQTWWTDAKEAGEEIDLTKNIVAVQTKSGAAETFDIEIDNVWILPKWESEVTGENITYTLEDLPTTDYKLFQHNIWNNALDIVTTTRTYNATKLQYDDDVESVYVFSSGQMRRIVISGNVSAGNKKNVSVVRRMKHKETEHASLKSVTSNKLWYVIKNCKYSPLYTFYGMEDKERAQFLDGFRQ